MRIPLILRTFAIATLLAILTATVTMYVAAQGMLLREANSAYSPDAVLVSGSPREALSIAEQEDLEVLIFTPVTDDWKTRAFSATRGAQRDIPTHAARWSVDDEHPGTLIGREATLDHHAGDGETTQAPVAGYLGSSEKSLLGDLVLIYDTRLVAESPSTTFVIDGPDTTALSKHFTFEEYKREGLSRRTSVDVAAPLLLLLSGLLLAVCSALSGILYRQHARRSDHVARLRGTSRPRIFAARMLAHAVAWLLSALAVGIIAESIATRTFNTVEYARVIGVALAISAIALAAAYAYKGRHSE